MPEYVTEKPKTVCLDCEHFFNTSGSDCPGHICKCPALPQPPRKVPNPVTRWVMDHEPLYCRNINRGNCPHFEAKEK